MNSLRLKAQQLLERALLRLHTSLNDSAHVQTVALWVSAIVAGLISVAFAWLFRRAESGFVELVAGHPFTTFLLTPLLFLAAWYVVWRFAPNAAGSGIPQIMAANSLEYTGANRPIVDRLLSLKTAGIKVLSSLLCVFGGGAVGREGPTLQISTSVFHFFGSLTRRFVPGVNEHTWIVAGAAAGLASAFNTPLGGIVYAIEELGLVHFHKVRTALISGVIVSGLVAQWLLGSYLYLGYPTLTQITFSFLPVALLNGMVTGLFGALFGKILLSLLNRRLALQTGGKLALATLFSGLLMACLTVYDPRASGTGIDLTMSFLFQSDTATLTTAVLRFGATLISYLSGAAGGIFSPSLSIGATMGSVLSTVVGQAHAHLMVLLGMIGFLTGVTRTPFTSFILVLEMTDRHSAIFPMMLAALAAQGVAHLVDQNSFYENVKIKFLPAHVAAR
ncbi:MAG: chloride channel protein [Bdellovibrionales bacterium]|nr:chloride channel protein [Bdellovibrionales bacterium]